ncbi:hypothetical protein [Streptomyces cinereoruber]
MGKTSRGKRDRAPIEKEPDASPTRPYGEATAYVALQDDGRWLMAVAPGGRDYLEDGDPWTDEPTAFVAAGLLTSSGRRAALAQLGYEEADLGGPWEWSEGIWEFDTVCLLCTAAVRPLGNRSRQSTDPWDNAG